MLKHKKGGKACLFSYLDMKVYASCKILSYVYRYPSGGSFTGTVNLMNKLYISQLKYLTVFTF